MKKDLVIVGAGGFGREIAWQISELGQYSILGYIDSDARLQGQKINGLPVLGDSQWLLGLRDEICAVICIGNSRSRKHVYNELSKNPNINFPTIIASNVRYSNSVTFGQGCIICLSTVLTVNITLGDFVIANLDCTIGHDAVLENFATLYPSVNVSGGVHVKACAEIGTGANIIQGKTIGENTIIGAGAVVTKDIPSNCTAVGTPAKPIKFHV